MKLKTLKNYDGVDVKHERIKQYNNDNMLALSVAEMDYVTSLHVTNALHSRIDRGIFGYPFTLLPYKQAVARYYEEREIYFEPRQVHFDQSVISSLYHCIRCFVPKEGTILSLTPGYSQFEKVIKESGRTFQKLECTMINHRFHIHKEEFEVAMQKSDAFILCSPHNPGGQLWSKEELHYFNVIALRYNVRIISDEVHSELVLPTSTFTSFYDISEHAIIINSPSKAYNLAGLRISYTICKSFKDSKQLEAYYKSAPYYAANILSLVALEAAYEDLEYPKEVAKQVHHNFKLIKELKEEYQLPISIVELEAGYLVWMDFSEIFDSEIEFQSFMLKKVQASVAFGNEFSTIHNNYCIRVNIATTPSIIITFMERLRSKLDKRILID